MEDKRFYPIMFFREDHPVGMSYVEEFSTDKQREDLFEKEFINEDWDRYIVFDSNNKGDGWYFSGKPLMSVWKKKPKHIETGYSGGRYYRAYG